MGWYKEYLQDLAEIEAEKGRETFFGISGIICGIIGLMSLMYVVDHWINSNHLYSIGCAILFLFMIPPTFICIAKGYTGGSASLFCCLLVVGCDIFCTYEMYEKGEFTHFEGYWKNDNNEIFEIFEDKSGAYFIYNIDGKVIAKKQDNKICGEDLFNTDFCINIKGNSAYYETDGDTTVYTRINKEEYDKILNTQKKEAFETLVSQLKAFDGNKAKDCVGYWKGEGLVPLQVSKNGKKFTIKYPVEDGGKDFQKSRPIEERRICIQETNTCYNAKELICEDNVQCMIAKGDSAYYFRTKVPFSLWGYIRTDKSDFDKEAKKIRKSSSK